MQLQHEIIRKIAVVAKRGSWNLELNLISWNGMDPKYDLRSWNEDHTKCAKGITLTEAEVKNLYQALGNIE